MAWPGLFWPALFCIVCVYASVCRSLQVQSAHAAVTVDLLHPPYSLAAVLTGCVSKYVATTPVTKGAAMLVPVLSAVLVSFV